MINFDNAATTFPKPDSVRASMSEALIKYGGNPGRSGHSLSITASEQIYRVRSLCGEFFGAEPENTVFTINCTHALNLAIHGVMAEGGHIIISDLEHNSVFRPVFALAKANKITYSVAHVSENPRETVRSFSSLITPETRAIACTSASNVTGQILPFKELGMLCEANRLCMILDGAQGCGVLPINLSDDHINILCTAGHKGLYGPAGTGLLLTDGKFPIVPIMQGGTGSTSLEGAQPDFLPDALESGTLNTPGILGLGAGVEFVRKKTVEKIRSHEAMLCRILLDSLGADPKAIVYRKPQASYVPIVAFNLKGFSSNQLSELLNLHGFALRGGLHCAGLAHKSMGTAPDGIIRFAPSAFNTKEQVISFAALLKKISQKP